LPFFNRVRQLYPNSERILVTDRNDAVKASSVDSLIGGSGLIDRTIVYPGGTRDLRSIARLLVRLRRTGPFDLVYLVEPRRARARLWRDIAFFRICGARNLHCAPIQPELVRCFLEPDTGLVEMEIERLARCFRHLAPIDLDDPELWDLHLTVEEIKAAEELLAGLGLRRFISVGLGGKWPAKDWGTENWRHLLGKLVERVPDLGVAVVGSADETARADDVLSACEGPTVNACGRLSPRQSAALLRQSTVFVGHDTGPMHLAASQAVPVVALFGSHNRPRRWHPYGRNHVVLHDVTGLVSGPKRVE
jgi:heptosyltransferase-3